MKVNKNNMPFRKTAIKSKYDIKSDDIVVVEKGVANAAVNVVFAIIKIIVYTLLLSLAFVGVVAIILPDTREILLFQSVSIINEFLRLIGVN